MKRAPLERRLHADISIRRRGTIGPKLKKSGGASAGACEEMSALDIVSVQLLTISS